MKISTWNLNSIQPRKTQLINWLSKNKRDIVLLQETKCMDTAFPRNEIEELGYNLALCGQKTFNGVAVCSLFRIDEYTTAFPGNPIPEQARYIETVISIPKGAVRIISVYVPNGGGFDDDKYKIKLEFMDALLEHLKALIALNEPVIIGGDFNVAPEELDVYDSKIAADTVLFNDEVRSKFRAFINLGYYDAYRILHPNNRQFSWWDYREGAWYHNKGMRIDHILLSPEICDRLKLVNIESEFRGNVQPSDHVPVTCELI